MTTHPVRPAPGELPDGTVRTFDYAYDPLGQLIEVRTDDVVTASYTYDANGNRLSSLAVPNATYSGETSC